MISDYFYVNITINEDLYSATVGEMRPKLSALKTLEAIDDILAKKFGYDELSCSTIGKDSESLKELAQHVVDKYQRDKGNFGLWRKFLVKLDGVVSFLLRTQSYEQRLIGINKEIKEYN